jgi:hypothetical protein
MFCPIGVPMFGAFSILCVNQCWQAPFDGLFHVFVFVTCKVIYSKYMWNSVNSKSICDQSFLIPPFYELINGRISSLVTINNAKFGNLKVWAKGSNHTGEQRYRSRWDVGLLRFN